MTVLLTAQELSKSYGHRQLFAGLSFDLRSGEKVGLVGPNGAGKTTLLKILAGLEIADTGVRSCRRGVCIAYLPQDEAFPAGETAIQVVLAALATDTLEAHERQTRAAISLTQVGFTDPDVLADSLSGGWRKRLALARELARRPDFLLLDEPTNHLDLPGVVWLERLLRGAPFGFLVATHDRAFLRAVANEVIEINRAYPDGVFRSDGGYEDFVQKRELFLEAQARQQSSLANQVRRETEWLSRKESAQRRKSRAMIEAAADRREDLADLKQRNAAAQTAAIDFAGTGRQTRKLLTANGIAKSLGGRQLFSDLDLTLTPGSKIGLLGPNGSGKSTLLRVLAVDLAPDAGTVVRADGLQSDVFEQARASLDPSSTLRRALFPGGDSLMYRGQPMHVVAWAKRFLFQPEQLDLELNALSGGEQARVRIAQLMLRTADLLLLDEPTNDLDIPALEVLEDSLADFPGGVVLVSHDRDLLDRLCTEFVGLDGRGGASVFGSVAQWLTAYENVTTAAKSLATAASKPTAAPRPTKTRKLSYKEQQEWDGMEAAILNAEEVLATRHDDVERAAAAGHAALTAACHALEEAQRTVEQLYSRWQELDARRGP